VSPILAIEFSPDGRLVLIGNEGGVVTLFSLSRSSFEVVYEMAVTFNDRLSMNWSRNGVFAVVGSKEALLILGRRPRNGLQPENHRSSTNPLGFGDYSIQKVVKSVGPTNAVSIDRASRFVAVGGDRTIIYDSTLDFGPVMEWRNGKTIALEWSPDRRFLATMSDKYALTIYDTSNPRPSNWTLIFSLKCDFPGRALCWSPKNAGGLQYLAYGGQTNHIYIMEIRSTEHTWETVLRIPREEHVYDLDWSFSGLLAAGSHRGTVAIIDLAYLQLGIPVREKDYKWQRQALTCFTEIRRNRGHNVFQAVRWIPSAPGSDSLLAVGGTDGEVEIIDLTERKNCQGYSRKHKRSSKTTASS
jgi:WD40 repeat protein